MAPPRTSQHFLGVFSTAERAREEVRLDMVARDEKENEEWEQEYVWNDDDDDDEKGPNVFSLHLAMPRDGPSTRSEEYALRRKAFVKKSMQSLLSGEPGAEAAFNHFRDAPWVEAWKPDGSGEVRLAPPEERRGGCYHVPTVLWTVSVQEIDQRPPPRMSSYAYTRS